MRHILIFAYSSLVLKRSLANIFNTGMAIVYIGWFSKWPPAALHSGSTRESQVGYTWETVKRGGVATDLGGPGSYATCLQLFQAS